LPSWATTSDSGARDAEPGEATGALPILAPDAPPRGVGELLQEAVDLYRKHVRVFLMTAAVLFLPASLVTSGALALLMAPLAVSTVGLERATERMARHQERLQKEVLEGMASGRLDRKEAAAAAQDVQDDVAGAGAAASMAMGGVMAVLLGVLGWVVMAFIVYSIVLPLTSGALTIAVADRILGGDATWRQHWGLLLRRLGLLLSALIPAALLCAVGYALLVLPGLVLSFLFAFVPAVVLIEGVGGMAALKRSVALVRSDWLRVALVFLAFAVVNIVAHFIGNLLVPSGSLFFGHFLGDLVTLLLLPVPVLGAVLLYLDLRRRNEQLDATRLREDLAALRG
jgi:hypothetical protein